MRFENLRGSQALLGERRRNPVLQEIRIGRVIDLLQLAAAAFGEMAAGRRLMVRAGHDGAVLGNDVTRRGHRHEAATLRHPLPARGKPDNPFYRHSAYAACR